MSPRSPEENWDLTPVIDLIYSLSVVEESTAQIENSGSSLSPCLGESPIPATIEDGSEQVLGNFDKIWNYLGQPLDLIPPEVPSAPHEEYIEILNSNGPDDPSHSKAVRWRDELEGADLADNDENHDPKVLSSLTKAQRKKARRKQRNKDQAEGVTDGKALLSGSGDDSGKDAQLPRTPDRRAIIDNIIHGNSTPETATNHLRSGKVFRNEASIDPKLRPVTSPQSPQKAMQILRPQKDSAFAIAAAKKGKLIAMLTETFIDERQFLSNISFIQHVGNAAETPLEGIHVFVDISNIMIGFHDALKLSRGQSKYQRIRRQPLSFHNFSLILERGRLTAKRIVVGSDNVPTIAEARAIGYETNILDRVHKAKELTPRQKKFMSNGNGTSTGSGSETTTATAAAGVQYAPEKWVEQAVDEILHLKMMESVVDASEPSTMVLATGDAAEAEYSGGFMKMVERALGKGWKVELACFRHNMSGAYNRSGFRQKWGERFKIVELDAFVEVLLGSE